MSAELSRSSAESSAKLPSGVSGAPLLITKLHPPQPRNVRVVRDQLDRRLEAHLQLASSVTLVVAPAGFGKTSLVSGYLATQEADYCWLSLDERDNDPVRFWRYLLAAIATVSEDMTSSAQLYLAVPQTPNLETVITLLVNDLSTRTAPLVIVLDDYHLIDDSAVHASLTFLLEHLPTACRLVVLSRHEPPLPLAGLRASGQLLELRQADLRFSEVESRNFLQQVMGLAVIKEDITQLEHSMEGWAAGLQMVALALQGKHDTHARIAEVNVHERYILDYLVEEVLEQQSPQVQTFLLESAVLGRMSASLCDAVLARDDSSDMLEQLERNNLFIVPLDDRHTWYRYHHLFADLLRHNLNTRHPERYQQLQHAAADYHKAQGEVWDAFEYYLQAGDTTRAAELLEGVAHDALEQGDANSLSVAISRLPTDLLNQRPRLLWAQAWHYLFVGETNLVMPLVTRAQAALQALPVQDDRIDRAQLELEYQALEAFFGHNVDIQQTIVRLENVLHNFNGPSHIYVALHAFLGGIYFVQGDLHDAARVFDAATARSHQIGSMFGEIAIQGERLNIERLLGNLHTSYQQTYALIDRLSPQEKALPFVGTLYARSAQIEHDWYQLEQAAQHAQEGLRLARRINDISGLADSYLALCLISRDQADAGNVQHYFAELQAIATNPNYATAIKARLIEYLNGFKVWLNLAEPEPWLDQYAHYVQQPSSQYEYLIYAHALLWVGRYEDALSFAKANADAAWAREHVGYYIGMSVVTVCAEAQLGRDTHAQVVLERVLEVAQPEGFVMQFLHGGEVLRELLQQVKLSSSQLISYRTTLLVAFEEHLAHHTANTSTSQAGTSHTEQTSLTGKVEASVTPQSAAPLEPLSAREQTVLRLLLAGMSNKQIARELGLSVNTVKTHARNVYSKFGVHGRMELVQQVKQLS